MEILGQAAIVFGHTAASWIIIAIYFAISKNLSRFWFVLGHYLVVIIVLSVIFGYYFRHFGHFSPFATMAIALVSNFAIELVVFRFFYPEGAKFLNFFDYILPIFISASAIYFVGILSK